VAKRLRRVVEAEASVEAASQAKARRSTQPKQILQQRGLRSFGEPSAREWFVCDLAAILLAKHSGGCLRARLPSTVVARFQRDILPMPGALVDLGIASAFDFFREVAWPNHVAFGRQPSSVAALNAVWAYWHLHEWHFWDHHPFTLNRDEHNRLLEESRRHRLSECPELEWLRDMAEAWKHRRLHRPRVRIRSVSTHAMGGPLGTPPVATTQIGATMTRIVVDAEGATRDLEVVLEAVSLYWLGTLLPYHVALPPGPPELSERMLGWCRLKLGSEQQGRWKWVLLQAASPPHRSPRLAFRQKADAEAFERWRKTNPGRTADC
jgi:hypothetical protein